MMYPRVLLFLLVLFSPLSAQAWHAGIPWWSVHVSGIVIGLLGLFLSGLFFLRTVGPGIMLIVLVAVWLVVMPWLILVVTDWVTPGIHMAYHAHGLPDLFLRVWLIGNLVPVILAAVVCWALKLARAG